MQRDFTVIIRDLFFQSLKKPVVPVIVGADDDWQSTVVGLLVAGQDNPAINLQSVQSEQEFDQKVQEIQ